MVKNNIKAGLVLLVLMCMLFAVACGSTDSGQETGGSANSDEKIVIRVGHGEPDGRALSDSFKEFAAYMDEHTDGRVVVQVHGNGELGDDRQVVESVSIGNLQMCSLTTAVLTAYDEKFSVLDLPFLFTSREAAFSAVDGELGQQLEAILPQYNIMSLGFQDNGLRSISNNVRPIYEPKDLEGIKIRVMESPTYIAMFNALGANPTPMAFGELYTGLSQGTVEAQENGASLVYTSKLYEVQDYFSLTNHVYSLNMVCINKEFFDSLPADIQETLVAGARECLELKQRELEADADNVYIEKLKEEGMEINEVTPENLQKFSEAVQPVYDMYADKIGTEIIDLAKSFN